MLLGVHVSIAGHIWESIDRAQALGCSAMQIFSRDPRQWRRSKLKTEDIREFRLRREKSGIKKVFIHIPYLINLASPYNILYQGSLRAYIQDMKEAQALGADYIVTHMGSHKESGEKQGLKRIIVALNRILDKTRDSAVGILLENTSGSGSWLGYKFEHQRLIIDGLENKKRVGICFDTCHAYTAGYDLASPEGYLKTIESLEQTVGLKRLKLVHLNDSRDELGSHADRHEHIGKGKLGLEAFRRIVNDPRLAEAAFVLETPKDSDSADKRNLKIVKKLIKK
ncbi:MAG: deoxyribonuclease IV [Candidatus Omnitrophica bacterium]|nr:deoxyribonuclease IV [Candidatus Omnitrophota bacterium]